MLLSESPFHHLERTEERIAVLTGIVYWQFYMPSRFLAPGRAAIAAVPFECISPGQEGGAFARGFDEPLATYLSKLDGVQVVSPSTVRRHQRAGEVPLTNILEALVPAYPEIAQKAHVSFIVADLLYQVDVTHFILDWLKSDDRTRKIVREIRDPKGPLPPLH